jgi:hypothetical protein
MRIVGAWIATVALVFGLALALPHMYRENECGGDGRPIEGLKPLKDALNPSASTALTTQQEASLHVLIAKFQASQTTSATSNPLDIARRTYYDAIVAGKKEAALAVIPTIANGVTESTSAALQREAEFVSSIIEVLDQNQVKALTQRFGAGGVVRFLHMLETATPLDEVDVRYGKR